MSNIKLEETNISKKGHSIICPIYGPLVELKRHCHNIARFFIYENPYDSTPISSWFEIASGIQEVKYISSLFDESVIWCGPAIEYEEEKSDFHSRLIRELTRFNFIWSGFEAFLDSIEIPVCKKQPGKINNVNYFLMEKYENSYPIIQYYPEVVEFLKSLIVKNPWYGDSENLFSEGLCASKNIIGLKVVYKIRNSLAHGAFRFSEPTEYSLIKPNDIPIIASSSRIVLFTMQMLLSAIHKDLSFKISRIHESPEEHGIRADKYLTKMHIKKFRYS
jgi:hypothetical protein